MNILCIIHELARNGAVMCLLDAVRHFRAQDHAVTVFVDGAEPDRQDSLWPDFEKAGAKIILRPDGAPYELAIVCTLLNHRWVSRLKGKLPLAWWIHEGAATTRGLAGVEGIRQAFAGADHLIFPNPNADKMFGSIFGEIPAARRSIVPPVIAKSAKVPPAAKSPNRFRVVCVGSLYPRKKQADLLAAAATLTDLPIECVLIGETAGMEAELAALLADNPGRFVTTGGLDAGHVQAYYRSADLFCLPSSDEHFPMAPLEAALHRLPILLSDLECYGGTWSHGRNALLHPVGDRLLLAAYLRSLHAMPELGARLGWTAESTALAFTERRFAAALDLAVEATLKRRAPEGNAPSMLSRLFGRGKRPSPAPEAAPAEEKTAGPASLPPPAPEVATLHEQAMALLGVGDLLGAAGVLRKALSDAPEDLRCLSSATMVATILKDYRAAEDYARQATGLAPSLSAVHVNLGNCLFEQGRFEEALACFQRGLELQPDLTAALLNCGHCYVAFGSRDEAAGYFAQAREAAADDPRVLSALGRAYLGIERFSEAESCLAQALAQDPSNAQAAADLERLNAASAPRVQPANSKRSLVFTLPGAR